MARSVPLLVAGMVAGGIAAALFPIREPVPAAPGAGDSVEAVAPGDAVAGSAARSGEPETAAVSNGSVSARVRAYERALGATGAIDLESMIDLAAAAPRSRARDLELAALVTRLSELDPRRAVEFARSAHLDMRLLIRTFEALARADAGAAIAELARITPAARQHGIALALLDVLGRDESAIRRIATALPDAALAGFELDALIARVDLDPAAALRDALERGLIGSQAYLLPRIAEAAVQTDPGNALALGDSIEDYTLRRSYQSSVITAWAERDPDAVFAFLESAGDDELAMSTGALRLLAQSDPDRLLAMVDGFPPAQRNSVRQMAAQTLADRDLDAALAMLDTLKPGQERETMVSAVARSYGRRNPELAFAWAKSLSPPSQTALQDVLQGIAAVDADRAVDLLMTEIDQQRPLQNGLAALQMSLPLSSLVSALAQDGGDVGRLADRLIEADDPQRRSMMSSVITIWAALDSEAALSWTLANADRLDAGVLRNLAQRTASQNLDLAISTLDRLDPARQAGWIQGVASQMAQTDVGGARSFIERLRGQPGYEDAFGVVVQALARADPVAAAQMLTDAPSPASIRSAAFVIAREWANRDPAAAAHWALSLQDQQLQVGAIGSIASTWVQRDAAAAERWLFSLGSGPNRDAAADGYLSVAAQVGRFEPRLLEAYSSEQAKQQGLSRVILTLGRSDPARAKELIDTYVADPAARAEMERQLERVSGARSSTLISSGGRVVIVQ